MPRDNEILKLDDTLANMKEVLLGQVISIMICKECFVNSGNDTRVPTKDVGTHLTRHENARLALARNSHGD